MPCQSAQTVGQLHLQHKDLSVDISEPQSAGGAHRPRSSSRTGSSQRVSPYARSRDVPLPFERTSDRLSGSSSSSTAELPPLKPPTPGLSLALGGIALEPGQHSKWALGSDGTASSASDETVIVPKLMSLPLNSAGCAHKSGVAASPAFRASIIDDAAMLMVEHAACREVADVMASSPDPESLTELGNATNPLTKTPYSSGVSIASDSSRSSGRAHLRFSRAARGVDAVRLARHAPPALGTRILPAEASRSRESSPSVPIAASSASSTTAAVVAEDSFARVGTSCKQSQPSRAHAERSSRDAIERTRAAQKNGRIDCVASLAPPRMRVSSAPTRRITAAVQVRSSPRAGESNVSRAVAIVQCGARATTSRISVEAARSARQALRSERRGLGVVHETRLPRPSASRAHLDSEPPSAAFALRRQDGAPVGSSRTRISSGKALGVRAAGGLLTDASMVVTHSATSDKDGRCDAKVVTSNGRVGAPSATSAATPAMSITADPGGVGVASLFGGFASALVGAPTAPPEATHAPHAKLPPVERPPLIRLPSDELGDTAPKSAPIPSPALQPDFSPPVLRSRTAPRGTGTSSIFPDKKQASNAKRGLGLEHTAHAEGNTQPPLNHPSPADTVQLCYDHMLDCYFDPLTSKYYQLTP